jgi:hypothetical protein
VGEFMQKQARGKWLVVALAFSVPLVFALFTNHIWEDYFITLRCSRNLVEGNGLVFTPGERVHAFTSPLGVLVPALCYGLAGANHEAMTIWIFRIINAGLLAAAAALAWNRMSSLRIGALGRTLFFGLILADGKLADFATDGMETAFLVFFVLLLWSELERDQGPRISVLAVACAGLEWTRPDAFILGAALIVPHLLFRRSAEPKARLSLTRLAIAGVLAAALYAPWLGWAWWYYGSPVPHTIIAKLQLTPPVHLKGLLLIPWHTLCGESLLIDLFLPANWFYGDWPGALQRFAQLITVIAAFAWVLPRLRAPARRASFAVFLGMFYVCSILLYPWYSPPWTVLAALAVCLAADQAAAFADAAGKGWLMALLRVATTVAIGVQAWMFVAAAWEMRVQQRVIEEQVRRDIGLWLHDHAQPTDTVFLESLGYIGYYSRLKTYDVPGLSSPEVVAIMKSGQRRLAEIIARLRPTWLVVRPFEFANPELPENAALRAYERVRTWDVQRQIAAVPWLPGRGWLQHDAVLTVYRLKAPPSQ